MKKLIIAVAALAGTSAAAQSVDQTIARQAPSSTTSVKWKLEIAPVLFGRVPFKEGDRVSDDNSATLSATFQQPLSSGVVTKITPALSYSRNFLGNAKDSSAFSTTFRFEKAHRFANPELSDEQKDVITPFASYKVELGFADVLHGRSYVDHVFAAGVTFKNVLFVQCREGENPGQSECTGGAGLAYSLQPSLEYAISDSDSRERITPKLTAELAYPTRRFDFILRGIGEARYFQDLTTASGRRRDYRFSLHGGVDLKRFFTKGRSTHWLQELSIGGRVVRNASNAAGEDFTRWQVLPVFSIGTRL